MNQGRSLYSLMDTGRVFASMVNLLIRFLYTGAPAATHC